MHIVASYFFLFFSDVIGKRATNFMTTNHKLFGKVVEGRWRLWPIIPTYRL